MSSKINVCVLVDYAHGINSLNELLRKYFLLFKSIAEQTARPAFIQLTFIQLSRQLLHNFSIMIEILFTYIFHYIVLNQSPCAFHFVEIFYFVEILCKNG